MSALLVFLTLCHVNPDYCVRDSFDRAEINHCYDENGALVLDQLLFWDWDHQCRGEVCEAWVLIKRRREPTEEEKQAWMRKSEFPFVAEWKGLVPRRAPDGWVFDFTNRDVYYRVTVKTWRETWTQYDPEVVNRGFVPKKQRKGFRKPEISWQKPR